ncbi:MAG: extracellular solute-binding protein [Chloroflexi bacterium]|nr:extracellular solute-binding protein [Chloroflexota bacterium]
MGLHRTLATLVAAILLTLPLLAACGGSAPATSGPAKPAAGTGSQPSGGSGLAPAASGPSSGAQKQMVIASFGGSLEKSLKDSLLGPFEKKFNVKTTVVAGTALENIARIKAQKAKPEIDVVIIADNFVDVRSADVFEKLDEKLVPSFNKVPKNLRIIDDLGAAWLLLTNGIAYNENIFEQKNLTVPTSINDLMKPEFKGRVVVWTPGANTGLAQMSLLAKANGGSDKNLDPAFNALKPAAPDLL